ncbi:hypothetical protein CVT26_000649 [Gymnopilus dilepis]|uniref:Uncharacterized protein n=1 Tax=Gymnopilus dilepis TaxID=231916 RepID=A0A409Y2L1_9AGAR|nr:hypothetical protein CVT26_000649 [Gymnopilus dilepis]
MTPEESILNRLAMTGVSGFRECSSLALGVRTSRESRLCSSEVMFICTSVTRPGLYKQALSRLPRGWTKYKHMKGLAIKALSPLFTLQEAESSIPFVLYLPMLDAFDPPS